jgi:hypothetical protein
MNQDLVNVVESLRGTVLFNGAIVQFTDTTFMDALKKIYESGVLAEREACAKLCEEEADDEMYLGLHYAEAIRARGQA